MVRLKGQDDKNSHPPPNPNHPRDPSPNPSRTSKCLQSSSEDLRPFPKTSPDRPSGSPDPQGDLTALFGVPPISHCRAGGGLRASSSPRPPPPYCHLFLHLREWPWQGVAGGGGSRGASITAVKAGQGAKCATVGHFEVLCGFYPALCRHFLAVRGGGGAGEFSRLFRHLRGVGGGGEGEERETPGGGASSVFQPIMPRQRNGRRGERGLSQWEAELAREGSAGVGGASAVALRARSVTVLGRTGPGRAGSLAGP